MYVFLHALISLPDEDLDHGGFELWTAFGTFEVRIVALLLVYLLICSSGRRDTVHGWHFFFHT